MDKSSEAILSLQPVTFRYRHELDPDGIPQFGLVAEQVEKVDPDLVARDDQGKAYTVRYEAVNAMLLNEFIKEHRKVEEQEHEIAVQVRTSQEHKIVMRDRKGDEQSATINHLKSRIAEQEVEIKAITATLKAQASQIQKVSAQLATEKPARRMVVNDQ